jgi:ABC-type transport system substrate-binding protein
MSLDHEAEILANVFETLIATDPDGNLVPWLCERWQVEAGGGSLLLSLRGDVRFQDGHQLTAEGVKNSFERAIRRNPDHLPAAFAALSGVAEFVERKADSVEGLQAIGERELEIRLSEPLPIYPAFLTDTNTGIVREIPGSDETEATLVGTGPFRVASRDDERILLQRSDTYWRGEKARLDEIEFRPGSCAPEIVAALRSGAVDIVRDLPPEELETVLRAPRLRNALVEAPKKNTNLVLFNCRSGPVAQSQALRRALSGLVRTNDLVWQTLGRFGQPATCLIPPGILGHDAGRKRHPLKRDEAVNLLESSDLKPPITLRASIHPLLHERCGALLAALFDLWKDVGVEVATEITPMAEFLRTWESGEGIDLLITRWNADYDDPDNFTNTLFDSRRGNFRSYFSSPDADQILEEARTERRPAAREALYWKLEALLHEQAVLLPLFHEIDHRFADPSVRGLRLGSRPPYVNYAELGKASEPAAVEPVRRAAAGELHVPISGKLGSLDPSRAYSDEQAEVLPCIFETLTRDVGQAQIVPWLASEFRIEAQGRKYRFEMRKGVRFHDGRGLTARDVRYSFERLLQNQASESRWLLAPIRGATAVLNGEATDLQGFYIHSAHGFTIELEEPVSFFPVLLSYPATAIIPEGSDPAKGDRGRACVGTGPFRLSRFQPGQVLELVANQNYWREGYPLSSNLTFTFGASPQEIAAGFREGRFSLASDLFPSDVEALRREPHFAAGYRETPRLSTHYVAFNRHKGSLQDQALRRSLTESVDVAALVRRTLGQLAIPAHGFIPPGLLGHDPGRSVRTSSARRTSTEELRLSAAVSPAFLGSYAEFAGELTRTFEEAGIHFERVNETMAEYVEAVTQGSVDVVLGRWVADFPDTDAFVHGTMHSKDGFLGRLCGSPEIDRMVDRGRVETNPAVRHNAYRQVEEAIAHESLLLPLFHEQVYRFARPEVDGMAVSYWAPVVRYEDLEVRG